MHHPSCLAELIIRLKYGEAIATITLAAKPIRAAHVLYPESSIAAFTHRKAVAQSTHRR
jgi:hypothetical protein